MVRYAKILPLIFLLEACIDRYDLPDKLYVAQLVVSGAITNEAGPYEVRLAHSSPNDTIYTPPIVNATVILHDDAGESEQLVQGDHAGSYVTQHVRGVVGRKYWLTITIRDDEYYTDPQELLPPGEIDGLSYEFIQNALNRADPVKPHHAIDLLIDSRGVEGYPNLYRWRWRTIHEMRTYPENRTRIETRPCVAPPGFPCPPLIVPDIPPCAFALANDGATCSCCRCWYERKSEVVALSDNRSINAIDFKQAIGRLAVDDYFFIRSYIEVTQMSVTEEAYRFWDLVRRQQQANGSLFQPNNFPIRGNVKSRSDSKFVSLGYFGVYGMTKKSIFINRFDFPVSLDPPGIIFETCHGTYPGATYEMPEFWN